MSGAKIDGSAKLEMLYKDPYQVLLKVFQKQKTKGKVVKEIESHTKVTEKGE